MADVYLWRSMTRSWQVLKLETLCLVNGLIIW